MDVSIRVAGVRDLEQIVTIFNQAITTRASVGYTREVTVKERTPWFKDHAAECYPIFVAVHDAKIIGWISLNPYRKGREAFEKTAETDCFIHEAWRRKGVGQALLQYLLPQARRLGYHVLIAVVLDQNTPSRALLEKTGFEQWGLLPEIGEIDGRTVSHVYYGKVL